MNTINTILNQTGPVNLSQLSDSIENEFTPDSFAKILIKGILAGDSIEHITDKAFKKLPKKLETDDHREEIRKLVESSIRNLLPQVDAKKTDGFLRANPEMAAASDVSSKGAGFIAKEGHEGLRLKMYDDGTGKMTIGIGHLLTSEEIVKYKHGITKEIALELYKQDLEKAVVIVKNSVKVPLNQHQFDALVSLAFNIPKAFNPAESTLLRKINAGDLEGASSELLRWNRGYNPATNRKEVMGGLVKRREAEALLFSQGTY